MSQPDGSPSSPSSAPHSTIQDDTLQFLLRTATLPLLDSDTPSSPSSQQMEDLAAETLVQRLSTRRQREREQDLDWDEQDNARRARALLDRLFPNEQQRYEANRAQGGGFDGLLAEDGEEEDDDDVSMHDFDPGDDRPSLASLFRAMAGPPGLEDDGINEEDERILGLDGEELIADWDQDYSDGPVDTTEMSNLWPGFVGQRPLNPAPSSCRSDVPPVVSSSLPQRSLPRDPSSALS
jgi:hypothetical protein